MNPEFAGALQVHSEARGPHWVAWLTEPGQPSPYRSVLVIGASQEEAEARAREWAARQADVPAGSPSSSPG
jgi:hypothetical protein